MTMFEEMANGMVQLKRLSLMGDLMEALKDELDDVTLDEEQAKLLKMEVLARVASGVGSSMK